MAEHLFKRWLSHNANAYECYDALGSTVLLDESYDALGNTVLHNECYFSLVYPIACFIKEYIMMWVKPEPTCQFWLCFRK